MTALTSLLLFSWALPNVSLQDRTIGPEDHRQVVETIGSLMDEHYVFPETASRVRLALSKNLSEGKYGSLTSAREFARTLNSELYALAKDKHIEVSYSYPQIDLPSSSTTPRPDDTKERAQRVLALNGGFTKVERLEGNLGYLKLIGFFDPSAAGEPAAAAMAFLANTDGLIVDLRENDGGHPGMVQLLCSYFVAEPTQLSSIYYRAENRTLQSWTLPYLPGKRYLEKPVVILTSQSTPSAAEAMAYDLQALKRAEVVGETTWGGANPGRTFRVHPHFRIFIPRGRAINPITNSNWEGVGVKPDISCPASDALKIGQLQVLKRLIESMADGERKSALERLRDRIA